MDYFQKYEPMLAGLFVFALVAGVFGLYYGHPSVQGYAVANLPSPTYVKAFGGFIVSFAVFFVAVLVLVFKNKKENE